MLMPSHSPELQPAERLWPLVNEAHCEADPCGIANRTFEALDDLEEVIYRRCQILLHQKEKERISGLTNFYWWPA